jgi:hypothetical protein
MKKIILPILLVFTVNTIVSQVLAGTELLEKAIAYHDPSQQWRSFRGTLGITMNSPNSSDRFSKVTFNLPANYFKLVVRKDSVTYEQELNKGTCVQKLNGSTSISPEDAQKYRLSCERAFTMKNYYTYLYGLPMKLKDPGTIIAEKVIQKSFKGKDYLVLKVTYEETVGKDVWYFYFDPKTYALNVYQFFHDEAVNDGEYILLEGEMTIQNMKIPLKRTWYTNKEDRYLGTDVLTVFSPL